MQPGSFSVYSDKFLYGNSSSDSPSKSKQPLHRNGILLNAKDVAEILDKTVDRHKESQLLGLFCMADGPKLNSLLQQLTLNQLCRLFSRDEGLKHTRAALLHIFSRSIPELTQKSKVAIIKALQHAGLDAKGEKLICEIFLQTKGYELTLLKEAVDCATDKALDSVFHRDLQELLYMDFQDVSLRTRILDHFCIQANTLRSQDQQQPNGSSLTPPRRLLKLISDIDDTLFVGWKDRRYPYSTVYPGVLDFYQALHTRYRPQRRSPSPIPINDNTLSDLVTRATSLTLSKPSDPNSSSSGTEDDEEEEDIEGYGITFITARPKVLGTFLETRHKLRRAGVLNATMLFGSIGSLLTGGSMEQKKYANFIKYWKLYPEFEFILVGDSGQRDIQFSELLLEKHSEAIAAVLIHDVMFLAEHVRMDYRKRGIILFDTYVGAALEALHMGLFELAATPENIPPLTLPNPMHPYTANGNHTRTPKAFIEKEETDEFQEILMEEPLAGQKDLRSFLTKSEVGVTDGQQQQQQQQQQLLKQPLHRQSHAQHQQQQQQQLLFFFSLFQQATIPLFFLSPPPTTTTPTSKTTTISNTLARS
mmetsp:Transcript_33807/g.56807  ORF Transcript_33807/g.56807 Transcript_33807/m.56807 type:complete len:590 (+) Transcript_33807:112-1881(+)